MRGPRRSIRSASTKGDLRAAIDPCLYSSSPPVHQAFQRRDDGPHQRRAKERRRPFGKIADDDRDAIALGDANTAKFGGDGEARACEVFIIRAFVFIDQEIARAIGATEQKQFAQSRRHVFPHAKFLAANDSLFHREGRARAVNSAWARASGMARQGICVSLISSCVPENLLLAQLFTRSAPPQCSLCMSQRQVGRLLTCGTDVICSHA